MFAQNIQYFSLPQNIRKDLTASEFNIIYLLFDLCQIRARNFPGKSVYAFPSQEYISSKIDRSREWISKCVQKLEKAGLITITHRRKLRGVWQTNLYRFGFALWKVLKSTSRCFSSILNHVNKKPHIVIKPPLISNNNSRSSDFSHNNKSPGLDELINRMTQKMGYAE